MKAILSSNYGSLRELKRGRLKFAIALLIIFLMPQNGFPWGETKHPIEEVLIQRLFLCDHYVFCGSDASWGTNAFGLFVFDRETEVWSNYCVGNGFPSNKVKSIEKNGQYVFVTLRTGVVRFNLDTGRYKIVETKYFEHGRPSYTLKVGDKTCKIISDSVIVSNADNERAYSPSISPPHYSEIPEEFRYGYSFSHPIFHDDKIYFAYNFHGEYDSTTMGIGSFDLSNNSFHFYPSTIFKGLDVTDCFIHNTSIIFPTAEFVYEGNARPAVGFVEFSVADSSFKIWHALPIPEYPLAIFCIEQDSLEYWIGTDRGILRVDKKTQECIHYGIHKGVMPRDGVNVYSCYGELHRTNQYPVVTELKKGETVDLLCIYNGWCEIKAPVRISGFILSSDVENIIVPKEGGLRKARLNSNRHGIKVKVRSSLESNNLAIFDRLGNPPKKEYIVVGGGGKLIEWYEIIIPTGWIRLDDISFSLWEIN